MDVGAMSTLFALLTVSANVFVIGAALVWMRARLGGERAKADAREFRAWLAPVALPFAWVVALVATAGSLYLSEVAKFVPCTLCWYQRIGMYPLALLLGIAVLHRDARIGRYVIPLALVASTISIYHYQLERFPSQTHLACSNSVPCTIVWIWKFHYISIPFMALSAFAAIVTLLLIARPTAPEPHAADVPVREKEASLV